jgi:hypothetical protein
MYKSGVFMYGEGYFIKNRVFFFCADDHVFNFAPN